MPRQLTAARKLLSDAQLVAFLRAAAEDERPRAPRYLLEELDGGVSLEEVFDPSPMDGEPEAPMQATLRVKRAGTMRYVITLGLGGDTVGDGGEWRVRYNAEGEVVELVCELMWVN